MHITNLTAKDVEKIEIDHGIIYINYGEEDERLLAPTRGGVAFGGTTNVRDIEFDGRPGKTAGMQVRDENGATISTTLLAMTQENLALILNGGKKEVTTLENPKLGVIPTTDYIKNVTMFAMTLDGKYKKFEIFNALSEGELSIQTQHKAEGELAVTFTAHYGLEDLDGVIWRISDLDKIAKVLAKKGSPVAAAPKEAGEDATDEADGASDPKSEE